MPLSKTLEIDMNDDPKSVHSPEAETTLNPSFPKIKRVPDRYLDKYKIFINSVRKSLAEKKVRASDYEASKLWRANTTKVISNLVKERLGKQGQTGARAQNGVVNGVPWTSGPSDFVDDIPNPALDGILDPTDTVNLTTPKVISEVSAPNRTFKSGNKIQLQPSVNLPLIEPLPKMNYWLPVQKNIVVEDDIRTGAVPFFADNDCDNRELYEEILLEEEGQKKKEKEIFATISEIKTILIRLLGNTSF